MTGSTTYTQLLDLAAGGLLLTAVLIVWRRELRSMVRLLIIQGIALAAVPIIEGAHQRDAALIGVGAAVLILRVIVLPVLLSRAVSPEGEHRRESTPLLNTTASLMVAAALAMTAFAISQPLVALDSSPAVRAAPAGFAVILIAVFVMVSRRLALSQAVGFLMLDNGIAAVAFLITAGVPVIVELGASLDVLFAVVILGVLTGRLRQAFGDTDLDLLQELRDR
jgi:hydrogenase-4 component E